MSSAAGPTSPPAAAAAPPPPPAASSPLQLPEAFARDAIIAWFRGEFAAANAIIDALCSHLTQIDGVEDRGSDYDSVFAAIHRRRLNWIPVLHMQKYFSIAGVATELRRVAAKKKMRKEESGGGGGEELEGKVKVVISSEFDGPLKDSIGDSSSDQKIPDGGGDFLILN